MTQTNNVLYPYPVVDRSIALGSTTGGGQSTTATTSALIFLNGTTGSASISALLTMRGGNSVIETETMSQLTIGSATTGPILLSPKGTTGLYVGSDGHVGIGNTNPAYELDVTGYVNGSTGLCIGGDCKTSWSAVSAASSVWQRNLGAVSPTNITDDVLVGGTATASAKIKLDARYGNATFSGILGSDGFQGSGLTDCDGPTQKLLWNVSTSRFGCGTNIGTVNSFTDTTSDTIVDNSTTDYWDGTQANLTPQSSSDKILVLASIFTNTTSANTATYAFTLRRDSTGDGTVACTDTQVGNTMSTPVKEVTDDPVITIALVDSPATTNKVTYTICADSNTNNPTGNVTRIDITLSEVGAAADLAEVYATNDTSLTMGHVVSLDPGLKAGVRKSTGAYGDAVGIVSTKPAQLIGSMDDSDAISGVPIALAGRVPVLVTDENGPVKSGDMLTTASTPGYAMKALRGGPVIGVAMSGFNPQDNSVHILDNNGTQGGTVPCKDALVAGQSCGKVMVFVKNSWYDPGVTISNTGDLSITRTKANGKTIYEIANPSAGTLSNIGVFADFAAGNIRAGSVDAQELRSSAIGLGVDAPATSSGLLLKSPNGTGITKFGTIVTGSDFATRQQSIDILGAIGTVNELRAVTYLDVEGRTGYGFIAQDVKKILPDIVYGEEGELSIDYNAIVSLLTKSVQEQQIRIDDIAAKVAAITAMMQNSSATGSTTAPQISQSIVDPTQLSLSTVLGTATTSAQFAQEAQAVTLTAEAGATVISGETVRFATGSATTAVEQASGAYASDAVGIVSTIAGGSATVVTQGKALAVVSTENGPILKGNYLTTSSVNGMLMKQTQAGSAVAVAIEDFDGTSVDAIALNTTDLQTATSSSTLTNLKDRLATIIRNESAPRAGSILVTVRPGFAMPPASCDLSDVACRSDYFARMTDPTAVATSPFDGFISSGFVQDLVVYGSLVVSQIRLSDNVGTATVVQSTSSVTISNPRVTEKSIIQVTFESSFAPATGFYVTKDPGIGFTVTLTGPVSADARLSWWIVENGSSSVISTPSIVPSTPMSTPTPTSVVAPTPVIEITPESSPSAVGI